MSERLILAIAFAIIAALLAALNNFMMSAARRNAAQPTEKDE